LDAVGGIQCFQPIAETPFAAAAQAPPNDLSSALKAIPDGRYRRGVPDPGRFLLLVAMLGIVQLQAFWEMLQG
jgi:hypothetical protein